MHREVVFPPKGSFFLLGPRQSGKSTLLRERFGKQAWILDLLQSDLFLGYSKDPAQFRREAEYRIEKEGLRVICVDEIQRIPALLNEIHALIEKTDCRFVLSGSSARKLRRESVNLLGGRAAECRLFPFTVAELGKSFDLETALHHGTLPQVWGRPVGERREKLTAYVHTYLQEEIRAEGLSRNLGGFSRFLDLAGQQSGEILNASAMARECGLPIRTVQSYYEILDDTLIGLRLPGWRHTVRKQLSSHPKFYLFDTGVTNALNGLLGGGVDARLKGKLFEQFLVLETQRRLSYAQSEIRMYYWRTNHGAEVDLVLEKHGKTIAAVEIKYSENITSGQFSGIHSFLEENPRVPAYMVCRAPRPFQLKGVTVLPWKSYLEKLAEWA